MQKRSYICDSVKVTSSWCEMFLHHNGNPPSFLEANTLVQCVTSWLVVNCFFKPFFLELNLFSHSRCWIAFVDIFVVRYEWKIHFLELLPPESAGPSGNIFRIVFGLCTLNQRTLRIRKGCDGVSSCHLFGGPFRGVTRRVWGFHRRGRWSLRGMKNHSINETPRMSNHIFSIRWKATFQQASHSDAGKRQAPCFKPLAVCDLFFKKTD